MNATIFKFPSDIASLHSHIQNFHEFLLERGVVRDPREFSYKVTRPSERDFTMEVTNNVVEFNPIVLKQKKCSFEYYLSIIFHELVHLWVHNIPNKSDAKRVKSSFANVTMRQFDVEADTIVAWYLKEIMDFSLIKYYKLLIEGTRVFGDPEVSSGKVERFIGSLISTARLFVDTNSQNRLYRPTFYLPCLCNRFDASVPILVQYNGYHAIANRDMSNMDIDRLRGIYVNADEARLSEYGCVKDMVDFVAKVLELKIPLPVMRELSKMR